MDEGTRSEPGVSHQQCLDKHGAETHVKTLYIQSMVKTQV